MILTILKLQLYLSDADSGQRSWPSQNSIQESKIISAVPCVSSCKPPPLRSLTTTATMCGKGNFNFVAILKDRANFISRRTISGCCNRTHEIFITFIHEQTRRSTRIADDAYDVSKRRQLLFQLEYMLRLVLETYLFCQLA